MSDMAKELNKGHFILLPESKTCKLFTEDGEEITDYYDYNGENIKHIRRESVDEATFIERDIFKQFREEYKNSEYLKKPTDIIIFTDSFSYSATSIFIKGFQNTGGAITVGYFGNPKINVTDLFDGSQSASPINSIQNFDLYKKLDKIGFLISQVTVGETFDDSIYGPNPIPRE